MKTLAVIFCYERPRILHYCAWSIIKQIDALDMVLFIDDSKTQDVRAVVESFPQKKVFYHSKAKHAGFSDSAVIAFNIAREINPHYLYLIEGDYIYSEDAFTRINDVFEHTEHGRNCLGITGYDAPNCYMHEYKTRIFPDCMKQQVGEDNVNRAVMHTLFEVTGKMPHTLTRESNTCFTSYLNWRKIQEVALEFPGLIDYLAQACAPRDNKNYPTSGEYKRKGVVDDGMLSHGISLVWNKWAMKHGLDRNEFAAWLNIRPSVANNINGGGMHTSVPECGTDNGSPSWRG